MEEEKKNKERFWMEKNLNTLTEKNKKKTKAYRKIGK